MDATLVIEYASVPYYFAPRILERYESVLVQTFQTLPAEEGLHRRVVRRCSQA